MPDPFLQAHAVNNRWFDIGGALSPISIRDQMIRARMIIDRSLDAHLISPGDNVLIVGGGVAGVSAAIRAAHRGLKVTLIYKDRLPFSRQAGCLTRFVDPVQYDWPVDHWDQGVYPWPVPYTTISPEPLSWKADYANVLAIKWTHRLFAALHRYPNLQDFHSVYPTFINTTVTSPKVRVTLNTPISINGLANSIHDFDLVVSCVGFGTERCRVPKTLATSALPGVNEYSGFFFWDADPFKQHQLGCIHKPNVLISGGGDGALQDFLRIATASKSAEELYKKMLKGCSTVNWPTVEQRIQCAEDQAQRAYIWGANKEHDHSVHMALHQAFTNEVKDLRSNVTAWNDICFFLDGETRRDWNTLTLLHDCEHFSKCYALNRFLVILLERYFDDRLSGACSIVPNSAVVSVECKNHTLTGKPPSCHGKQHDIYTSPYDCFSSGLPSPGGSILPGSRNVVIIRHGIVPGRPSWGTTPPHPTTRLSNLRQILPYFSHL